MIPRFQRAINSPLLFVLVFVASLTLSALWFRTETALAAPQIGRYNWENHPNALLVFYRGNCCGTPVSDWIEAGTARDLDVLIASEKPSKELRLVAQYFGKSGVTVETNVNRNLMTKFSPNDVATIVRVQNGRITRQVQGTDPESFFANERR